MKVVEAVIVGYYRHWNKWPDSGDVDYSSVLSRRQDTYYEVNGETVTVRLRWYPVHRAYALAGVGVLPLPHPCINNTLLPPQSVLLAMLQDLTTLSRDGVTICFWEHAYQCYPFVAQHLGELFELSVLIHGDDCPSSTPTKTAPTARFFNSVFYCGLIYDAGGKMTRSVYNDLGVADTHYISLSTTGGFLDGMKDVLAPFGVSQNDPDAFLDWRSKRIRAGQYAHDMVFVGASGGVYRPQLNTPMFAAMCQAARVRTRFCGVGMRDGMQGPIDLTQIGRSVAPLYLDSFSVINRQVASLVAGRMFDSWASGTLLLQWDPFGEMKMIGAVPGVHYAEYDGSLDDVVAQVKYYQAHLDETESIIRAGYVKGMEVQKENSRDAAIQRVLAANARKLGLV